jgi:hypothetical protein
MKPSLPPMNTLIHSIYSADEPIARRERWDGTVSRGLPDLGVDFRGLPSHSSTFASPRLRRPHSTRIDYKVSPDSPVAAPVAVALTDPSRAVSQQPPQSDRPSPPHASMVKAVEPDKIVVCSNVFSPARPRADVSLTAHPPFPIDG